MKLVTFQPRRGGAPSFGVARDDGIVDLGADWPDVGGVRGLIERNLLAEAAARAKDRPASHALADVTLLPPIPVPGKILCVGRNYMDHVAELGDKPRGHPSIFIRLTNTLVGHEGQLVRPKVSDNFDFEGELLLVIGKHGRHIKPEDALDHIAGYACFNDASVRNYQFEHCLIVGKNFHATGGFGPWIVTADEVGDPRELTLETRLNGQRVQHSTVDKLIWDIPTLINYLSTITPLEPGDVIATGTPEGVGYSRKPQLWMKPGDTIEVDISRIGVLRHTIVDEAA
ncbi:fumarylacetoacetate hydrolase family protein [Pigmentiphaga soli]|uniref:Fumarylacetoacetate hydrolase family protein n=1 Tax=Pigmentiphaga soli TaxID=1007095 RepID=A0ABP8H528_9BURK